MTTLQTYQQETQRLLHDPNAQAYSLPDINDYIDIARKQVAIEGECIRVLISGGSIVNLFIVNGGSGYVTPILTITGLGAQAFATASQVGGSLNSVNLTSGGWGYIGGPTITVTDIGGPGVGAVVAGQIDGAGTTTTGVEVVQFSSLAARFANWNTANFPPNDAVFGCSQVIKVFSIACNQAGTYKPMLQEKIWSEFQAYLRIYSNTQQNYPIYWSKYGQGVNGSIYLFPWPAQPLQLDIDVCATPVTLSTNPQINTPEAIPYPWTDAIPYFAAYRAYKNSSRVEDAENMLELYKMFMKRARAYSENPFMPDYYGYEY